MTPFGTIPCEPDVSVRHPAAVRLPPDHQVRTTARRSVGRPVDTAPRPEPEQQIAAFRPVGPQRAAGHDRPIETANGSVMSGWYPGTGWEPYTDPSETWAGTSRARRREARPPCVPPLRNLPGPRAPVRSRPPFRADGDTKDTSRPDGSRVESRTSRHLGASRLRVQGPGALLPGRSAHGRAACEEHREGPDPGGWQQRGHQQTLVLVNSGLTWSGLLMEECQHVMPIPKPGNPGRFRRVGRRRTHRSWRCSARGFELGGGLGCPVGRWPRNPLGTRRQVAARAGLIAAGVAAI